MHLQPGRPRWPPRREPAIRGRPPGQQLEVHRRGKWEQADAAEVSKAVGKTLLLLNQRPAERAGARPVYYEVGQQLLVYWEGEWSVGSCKQHFQCSRSYV